MLHFHGKKDDTLTIILDPASLPPTEIAASYHAFGVHSLVEISWLEVSRCKQVCWGIHMVPFCQLTTLGPSPSSMLKYTHWYCEKKSKNTCVTMVCTCWKNGL